MRQGNALQAMCALAYCLVAGSCALVDESTSRDCCVPSVDGLWGHASEALDGLCA